MFRLGLALLLSSVLPAAAQNMQLRYTALLDPAPISPAPTALSADGSMLAIGGKDGSIRLWRLDSPGAVETIRETSLPISALAFDPDGSLVMGGQSIEIRAYNPRTRTSVALGTRWGEVGALAASRNAVAIAAPGSPVVEVRARGSSRTLRKYAGHSSPVKGLAFSPDGERLVAGEFFRISRIWNLGCNCLQQNVSNRSTQLHHIAFSSDGRWLAVTSESGIQIADTVSGKEMQRFYPRSGSFVAAAFHPDGSVVAVSRDAGLRLLRSDPLPFLTAQRAQRPALHILVAGINAYADRALRLGFAQQDANDIAAVFEQNADSLPYAPRSVRILAECATRQELIEAFRQVAQKAQPGDAMLVFFAGHGRQEGGEFWYYTHRFRRSEPLPGEAVSSSEIATMMAAVPASNQILIMDACQSGSAVERISGAFAQAARTGRKLQILSASGANEEAMEAEETGHGLLTAALLDHLRAKIDARQPQTAAGWLQGSAQKVPALAAQYNKTGSQKPAWQQHGGDFPLLSVPPGASASPPTPARAAAAPPPEFSGVFSCRPTAADKTFIRPEGLTELMGDIVFRCAGTQPPPSISVQVFFNSNFTSKALADGSLDAALFAEPPGTRTDVMSAKPVHGRVIPQMSNVVQFDAVPVPHNGGAADVQFRIAGLRANANQLGASATLKPTAVVTYYVVRTPAAVLVKDQAEVGYASAVLRPATSHCSGQGPAPTGFARTSPQDGSTLNYAVQFTEGYPEHFLPSLSRLSQREFPNGLALAAESAGQGTRLLLEVLNIPSGVDLYATVRGLPGASSPAVRARLTVSDSLGGGPFEPVEGKGSSSCDAIEVRTAKLSVVAGRALAVWEVLSSDPNEIERLAFGLAVAYAATPEPGLGQVIFTANYAPLSTMATSHPRAPIPRFAQIGMVRNLFSIERQ